MSEGSHAEQAGGDARTDTRTDLQRFASMVTHDLRNPLLVARGNLSLLQAEGLADDRLDAADEALERAGTILSTLLTYAENGESVGAVEPVRLSTAADDAWAAVDPPDDAWAAVDPPDATLVLDTEAVVLAHPGSLERLLDNLFRNAVQHGRPDVTVTVGDLDGGFSVADDGPGIPVGRRETVFDLGVSSASDSTGLGLTIVEQFAHAHGWTVTLTEGEAGGARFEFRGVETPQP